MTGRIQIAGPAETAGASGTLSLVSVAELQAYISQGAEASFDVLCQTIIDSVCFSIFSETGGRFIKRPATEFDFAISPESPETLFLHQYPVGTISAVELGSFTNGVWAASVVLSSVDWYVDSRGGRLFPTIGAWPEGRHSVRVVWTGGFPTVPGDIKEAALQWAAVKLSRVRKGRFDAKSLSGPTEGFVYEEELTESVRKVIRRYALSGSSVMS